MSPRFAGCPLACKAFCVLGLGAGLLMFRLVTPGSAERTPPVAQAQPAAAVAAAPAELPGSESWTSFRNSPQLRGIARTSLPPRLELRWKHAAGEMVTSTAAIAGGRVYVGSLKGEVLCLDLKTGQRIWTYRSIDDPNPQSFAPGFKSSPTVTADSVYLGDEDGIFHALDRQTGKRRWSFKTQAEIVSSATLSGDKVLFGSHDNSLYCLAAQDGRLVWKFETQGPVNCTPAVVGHATFITGCDEHLRVIDIESDPVKEIADIPLGTYLIASPAVVDNVLYVGTYASEVVAVDWQTRQKLWTYRDPEKDFPYHSSAAVTERVVVVGGRDKRVHAIDRLTGKGLWTFDTRGKVDSSPAILGERVFVGSQDGNVYELRLQDGREVWRFTDGRPFTASPAIGEGCLVIGSESNEGWIYCFGAK